MTTDRTINFWCAVGVGTLCGLVVAITWLPLGWVVPQGLTIGLFILIFPIFGWAVIREAAGGGKMKPNDLLARVPTPARYIVGGALVALWLSVMTSFFGPAGQPVTENGRRYLNNHGEFTEVDQDTYDDALNRGARGFLSGAAAFCVVAGVMSKYGGTRDSEPPNGS